MPYVPDANNTSEPTSGRPAGTAAAEFRAIKQKIQSIVAGAVIATAAGANAADITTLIQPDVNDRPAIIAGGWIPWNLNQGWGGAGCIPQHMIDSATGNEYKFDMFDGYIDTILAGSVNQLGDAAARYYRYQCINPQKNLSLQAVWLRLWKQGNPTDNVTVQLWSVAAGAPNALVATAAVINGKQITSESWGQWYRFAFAAPQALVAGTQYVIVAFKSAGVDAANYYNWVSMTNTKFPSNLQGAGTAVPVWTAGNTTTNSFMCEAQASDQVVQSAGSFNGRIVGSGTCTPVNRSTAYCKPLREFFPLFHPNGWSILIRGKSWSKDCTIFDAGWGLHHDRINVRCAAATGFTTVTIYESDNTVNTVVGTSDVSTAAFKDILIVGRSLNDAGDYLKIYTGVAGVWTLENSAVGQSYSFDNLMLRQGTAWIMGGFQLFQKATYTGIADMSVLPSAAAPAWTYTAGGTPPAEASVFNIANGKLNQIKAGFANGDSASYIKAAAAFVNANGWFAAIRLKVLFNTDTKDQTAVTLRVEDGTKNIALAFQNFYHMTSSAASGNYMQQDARSADCVYFLTGKGSDALSFCNFRLSADLTSLVTTGSANNQIKIGDETGTAGENADAQWGYAGYYNTANIYPQFTAGELHEFSVFSGDKNLLGQALYNAGVPLSVKQYCGIQRGYVGEEVVQKHTQLGITASPTSTDGNTGTLAPEMEVYTIGALLNLDYSAIAQNNGAGGTNVYTAAMVDGRLIRASTQGASTDMYTGIPNTGYTLNLKRSDPHLRVSFGLHKVQVQFGASANTTTFGDDKRRLLHVKANAYA